MRRVKLIAERQHNDGQVEEKTMSKKLSKLEKILSIAASVLAIVSIAFGWLWGTARNATTEIVQPDGPLEVRLVDLPDFIDALQRENESLRENFEQDAQVDEPEMQVQTTQTATQIAPVTSDVIPLFTLPLRNEHNWRVNSDIARDGRGELHAPDNFGVITAGWGGRAEYIINENFSRLTGIVAPHYRKGNHNTRLYIYVHVEGEWRLLYSSQTFISNISLPVPVDVNLSQVIEFDAIRIRSDRELLLMDFELHR